MTRAGINCLIPEKKIIPKPVLTTNICIIRIAPDIAITKVLGIFMYGISGLSLPYQGQSAMNNPVDTHSSNFTIGIMVIALVIVRE